MRVTDLLRTMDIFQALPAEDLATIAQLLQERRLAASDVLCRQGEPGDSLFIVTGGRIRLSTVDSAGNEKVLTYFTDGQFFGEMALLSGAPRSATAIAETESQLLVLHKQAFDQLLAAHPQVMREMLRVVSQRTLQTNQQLVSEEAGSTATAGAGRVYAVYSPRGGSGKTTLAVNFAVEQARRQPERTALLELNLTFGHAAALLGLRPETALAEVPSESLSNLDRRTLGQYLVEHHTGLQLLVATTRPEQGELVTHTHVRAALGALKRQFSSIFVDCGSALDEPTMAALEMADKVVLVCTPELNTLRDVRECQRVFSEILHLDPAKVSLLFNYHQPFAVLAREQFETALEESMQFEVPHAGEAAYKAAAKGEALVLTNRGAAFSKAVEKVVRTLVPAETRADRKRGLVLLKRGPSGAAGASERAGGGLLAALLRKKAS